MLFAERSGCRGQPDPPEALAPGDPCDGNRASPRALRDAAPPGRGRRARGRRGQYTITTIICYTMLCYAILYSTRGLVPFCGAFADEAGEELRSAWRVGRVFESRPLALRVSAGTASPPARLSSGRSRHREVPPPPPSPVPLPLLRLPLLPAAPAAAAAAAAAAASRC